MIESARRAAIAERYPAGAFDVEWRPLSQLADIRADWQALAAHALEPNVFYEPDFALAAATVFGNDAGAVLVRSGTDPHHLLGLFPARIEQRRYGLRLPVLVGWTHPYAPLGTPLVEREAASQVILAWLDFISRSDALPDVVLLPLVPPDGAFAAALDAILARGGMRVADFNRHRRAVLAPHGNRPQYIERALGTRRLKELRRIGRRLEDMGAVLFAGATEPLAVEQRLAEFFSLEASGWKGRAGTAAALHDNVRRFIETALAAMAAEGKVQIDRMTVDGRTIAVTVTLRNSDQAWFWKIAYDEDFARYSPGVMLTVSVTERMLADDAIARTDSCATADHPMIDRIWRERLTLTDRLFAVSPQAPFGRARNLEGLRRTAIAAAKKMRGLVRRG
jgi:CelD/BcsL family acetyltransferase involved in cellulose biosynthesis